MASVEVVPLNEKTESAGRELITVLGELPTVAEELSQEESEDLFPNHEWDRARQFPPKRHLGPIETNGTPTAAEILGAAEASTPLLTRIFSKFAKKQSPTYVRLDTAKSYKDFRATQSPEMAELQQKVAELALILRGHIADGHGNPMTFDDDLAQVTAHDVMVLWGEIQDKQVPIKLPPFADGKYSCWHEPGEAGGVVCASLMLPGPDGELRIATAATPVFEHVVEVCGHTQNVGGRVTELLGVLPTVACMLGGSHLIPRMARAAPKLLARPEVQQGDSIFVGKIVPYVQPSLAAIMTLCQKAQSGDAEAIREWKLLAKYAEAKDRTEEPGTFSKLVRKARALVQHGQSVKKASV